MTPSAHELIARQAERGTTLRGLIAAMDADEDLVRWNHEQATRDFVATLRATKAAVDVTVPTASVSDYGDLLELVEHDAVPAALDARAPFSVPIPVVTSQPSGGWVAAGGSKPVAIGALESVTLTPFKISAITVLSRELVRMSSPAADAAVRRIIAAAARRSLNSTFLSADSAVASTSPAGLLNGLTPITFTDYSDANLRDVVVDLIDGFERPVLIGARSYLTAILAALGRGADLVRTIPAEEAAGTVIAVDESRILVGFAGVNVLVSDEAAIEMSDSPSAPAALVSMFQTNSVALRADAFANWWAADDAVRVLQVDAS